MDGNGCLAWFRRLMWAGIVANVALALVSIAMPGTVLELLGLAAASPLVWPQFAAFLLLLLTVFYVPGAIDPLANRFSAVFSLVCRFGGVFFFAVAGGHYFLFGAYDLVIALPQALLLAVGLHRLGRRPGAAG